MPSKKRERKHWGSFPRGKRGGVRESRTRREARGEREKKVSRHPGKGRLEKKEWLGFLRKDYGRERPGVRYRKSAKEVLHKGTHPEDWGSGNREGA